MKSNLKDLVSELIENINSHYAQCLVIKLRHFDYGCLVRTKIFKYGIKYDTAVTPLIIRYQNLKYVYLKHLLIKICIS